MKYVVKGKMKLAGEERPFTKQVEAPSPERAKEAVYTLIGSAHHLKRHMIVINEVAEMK